MTKNEHFYIYIYLFSIITFLFFYLIITRSFLIIIYLNIGCNEKGLKYTLENKQTDKNQVFKIVSGSSPFDLNFFGLKSTSEPTMKFPSLSALEKEEEKSAPKIPIPPHSPGFKSHKKLFFNLSFNFSNYLWVWVISTSVQ